jgi:hypothetical protein
MRTINAQRGGDWRHTARPAVTFSQLTTEARTRGALGTQTVGYNYDPCNSNRLYKANLVSAAAGVPLDEAYVYDNLDRLTQMQLE